MKADVLSAGTVIPQGTFRNPEKNPAPSHRRRTFRPIPSKKKKNPGETAAEGAAAAEVAVAGSAIKIAVTSKSATTRAAARTTTAAVGADGSPRVGPVHEGGGYASTSIRCAEKGKRGRSGKGSKNDQERK